MEINSRQKLKQILEEDYTTYLNDQALEITQEKLFRFVKLICSHEKSNHALVLPESYSHNIQVKREFDTLGAIPTAK